MIGVLGPLGVDDTEGRPLDVGSPRHREVLAALVVDAGRVVSSDALLERVWGDVGRGASTSNLHAVISRLRARLAGAGVELVTVAPGYRLDAAGAVDAERFADLVARAGRARASGDPAAAHRDLVEALGLWRGPAYADIALPFAEVEAARLEGRRVAACELLVDVELELGLTAEALERLPALVAAHPLRETFRRQQMLALYRAGRQAEALAVHAELRELLADELGIDPGPAVQELYQRILAHDGSLGAEKRAASGPASSPRSSPPSSPSSSPVASPAWHSDVVVPPDTLLGRDDDVTRLHDLLTASGQRLVTVTGIGGVGKTRVAHAVAAAARGDFEDGVAVVSLAPLTDVATVLPAVGRAVGLAAVEGLEPLEAVVQHLRSRRVLVVLDNVEHLLDVAPLVARLVALCPRLAVLATSRTALRVRGELQYQLAPLTLPGEDDDPAVVGASAAVALFVDRARGVQPDFALDGGNAGAVAAICRRLAGIPLALELAAARAHLMPPEALAARLDRVMRSAGARDLPPRQRTMRATLEWSHQLLDPDQQLLLRRLAVFSDGFTLEAAEAVLDDHPDLDALVLLEELVGHSLVLRDVEAGAPGAPGPVRFRLLEPVAQFADELLTGPERVAARDAHLAHFLAVAEATEPGYRGTGTAEALALTQREHANLVAAIEWGLASAQGERAGRLVWAVWLFWWLRGNLLVGRRLAEEVIALAARGSAGEGAVPTWVLVRAHAVLGAMAFAQGDTRTARSWCVGATLARAAGDPTGEAHNVAGEGLVALAEEHLDEAEVRFVETVRLTELAGDAGGWLWTLCHVWRATVRLLLGFPDQAVPLLDQALAAARERHDPLAIYISLFTSAQVRLVAGDLDAARSQLDEGIVLSLRTGDMANLAYFLEALAVVEAQEQRPRRVALLHGAAARLRETVGANVYGYYQPDEQLLADALRAARGALGPAYDDVVAQGRALEVEQVAALAGDPTAG